MRPAAAIRKSFDLSNRSALVTGGSKGIGRAIAHTLVAAGARVVLTARGGSALEATVSELRTLAGREDRAFGIETDHAEPKQATKVAESVRRRVGDVDILINNVGSGLLASIEEMTLSDFARLQQLNVSTGLALAKAFVPGMKARGWGRIINSSSLFGLVGAPDRVAYCTSKAAVAGLTRALAIELAPHGVTVNALAAGPMRTPLMTQSWASETRRRAFAALTLLDRWGEPDEVGPPVLLLASEAGRYITGQVIAIDGGASAR